MKTKKIFRPLSGWNLLLIVSLVSVLSIIILSSINFPAAEAAGSITGRVFHDYNSNGAYDTTSGLNSIDRGVTGVTVTAYDAAGVSRGTTTTNASG
ncbi:MAG TPA: SdrD B-like domain-containing protein, partial [Pyrinomonadaceae bacterium]